MWGINKTKTNTYVYRLINKIKADVRPKTIKKEQQVQQRQYSNKENIAK